MSDIIEETPDEEIDIEKVRKVEILRNAYQKLDSLSLGFGLPAYSDNIEDDFILSKFRTDIKDTMREMKISDITNIQEDSYQEMIFENRIVYHALKRFRNSASLFFKFSTAIDGKTVDKTKIPEMLGKILKDYDDEYKKYKGSNCAGLWQMETEE